jgi:hypothetical protein
MSVYTSLSLSSDSIINYFKINSGIYILTTTCAIKMKFLIYE